MHIPLLGKLTSKFGGAYGREALVSLKYIVGININHVKQNETKSLVEC